MNHSKSTPQPKVSRASKKIQKITQANTPRRRYNIQSAIEKLELKMKIRKTVDRSLQNENWFQIILKYKPVNYKPLLRYLYPKLDEKKRYLEWKKIKRMLEKLGKPNATDYRGNALCGNPEEEDELKKHIEWVIENRMETKNFEKLREHVLPKIQEMFERKGREFSNQVFQKHFWSYFCKTLGNQNVKDSWSKLPRTKPNHGKKTASSSSESSVSVGFEIETPSSIPAQEEEEKYENDYYEEKRGFEVEDPDRFLQSYSNQDFQQREEVCGMKGFLPLEHSFERNNLIQDELFPRMRLYFEQLSLHFDDEGRFGPFE